MRKENPVALGVHFPHAVLLHLVRVEVPLYLVWGNDHDLRLDAFLGRLGELGVCQQVDDLLQGKVDVSNSVERTRLAGLEGVHVDHESISIDVVLAAHSLKPVDCSLIHGAESTVNLGEPYLVVIELLVEKFASWAVLTPVPSQHI